MTFDFVNSSVQILNEFTSYDSILKSLFWLVLVPSMDIDRNSILPLCYATMIFNI